jgi:hypothetical protein
MLQTFQKNNGTYKCRSCGHQTRNVEGDEGDLRLCLACYTLAGEENSLSDTGELYDLPSTKRMMERLDRQCGTGTAERLFNSIHQHLEKK